MTTLKSAPNIELREAHVAAARGTVFGPLSASSHRPVTVVCGASGSGRTSLLLSIAGRMRLSDGTISTLGDTGLAAIRARTGIAGFAEIDALEPAVSLGATLRERLAWALPWYRRTPRMSAALTEELLRPAFGDAESPDPGTLVRDLTSAEQMLTRIALALIERPQMLIIDDFDALRDPADRARVAERLSALASGRALASGPARASDRAAAGEPHAFPPIAVVLATSDPHDATLFAELEPATITL